MGLLPISDENSVFQEENLRPTQIGRDLQTSYLTFVGGQNKIQGGDRCNTVRSPAR